MVRHSDFSNTAVSDKDLAIPACYVAQNLNDVKLVVVVFDLSVHKIAREILSILLKNFQIAGARVLVRQDCPLGGIDFAVGLAQL